MLDQQKRKAETEQGKAASALAESKKYGCSSSRRGEPNAILEDAVDRDVDAKGGVFFPGKAAIVVAHIWKPSRCECRKLLDDAFRLEELVHAWSYPQPYPYLSLPLSLPLPLTP